MNHLASVVGARRFIGRGRSSSDGGLVKGAGPGRAAYFSLVNLGSLAWL